MSHSKDLGLSPCAISWCSGCTSALLLKGLKSVVSESPAPSQRACTRPELSSGGLVGFSLFDISLGKVRL